MTWKIGLGRQIPTKLGCTSALSSKLHIRCHYDSTGQVHQQVRRPLRGRWGLQQWHSRDHCRNNQFAHGKPIGADYCIHWGQCNPNQCIAPTASRNQQPAQSPAASNTSTNGHAIHELSTYNDDKDLLRSPSPRHIFSPSPSKVPTAEPAYGPTTIPAAVSTANSAVEAEVMAVKVVGVRAVPREEEDGAN